MKNIPKSKILNAVSDWKLPPKGKRIPLVVWMDLFDSSLSAGEVHFRNCLHARRMKRPLPKASIDFLLAGMARYFFEGKEAAVAFQLNKPGRRQTPPSVVNDVARLVVQLCNERVKGKRKFTYEQAVAAVAAHLKLSESTVRRYCTVSERQRDIARPDH